MNSSNTEIINVSENYAKVVDKETGKKLKYIKLEPQKQKQRINAAKKYSNPEYALARTRRALFFRIEKSEGNLRPQKRCILDHNVKIDEIEQTRDALILLNPDKKEVLTENFEVLISQIKVIIGS